MKFLYSVLFLVGTHAFATDLYNCEITGRYTEVSGMQKGQTFSVESESVKVEVGKRAELPGFWHIDIDRKRDGGQEYLRLSVGTPYRHIKLSSISEVGSKFLGVHTFFENGAPYSSAINVTCMRE